ncbi:MAG: CHAD domain-containing protein, partial [Myxococcota bacterium]
MTLDPIQLRPGRCWRLPLVESDPEIPPSPPVDVPPAFTISLQSTDGGELTVYDTWEWSLWASNRLLLGDGRTLRIVERDAPARSLGRAVGAAPPRFAWDQPDGPLADHIAPLLDLRAVLPVAALRVEEHRWVIRNTDDKIVVRLLEQRWSDVARTVQVLPLRGYAEEAKRVEQQLPKKRRQDTHPLRLALAAADVTPRVWTNKPPFAFADKAPAQEAVVAMLRVMLSLAQQTEAGIIDDDDTEFLHDYRVLIRKARSVLSLTKGVLHPDATADLKASFRDLARRTNLLRDLDVHLLERDEQAARVPERLRAGLGPLFADLEQQRADAQAAVAQTLKSRDYQRQVAALARRVERAPAGPKGDKPIRAIADARLRKQLGVVLKRGGAITPQTPDEEVHELRIDCKKLRYLLEFYRHLYPPRALKPLVKDLKKLQDVLGTFNDRSVQQDAMLAWLDAHPDAAAPT